MKRIYKGYIYCDDEVYFEKDFTKKLHTFINNGFWVGYGNREVNSYVLCDENGEEIEKYSHIQFSKTRSNIFYVESVD